MHWLIVLGSGFVGGLILTRLARDSAARFGLVDAPDGRRKTQTRAIPVAGGISVLTAALVAIAVAFLVEPETASALTANLRHSLALLASAVLITAIGFVDDVRNLRARFKFLGQLLAVAILIGPGDYLIDKISLLGWGVPLGPFAIPCTAFWLLACINALNLIDGMDGLLGTVGLIALMSCAVIAAMSGQAFTVLISLALAGALIGFLWYNLPPASIYMGDSGSMLIGLAIGALAIPASLKGPATVALGAPVALLVLPMMDTTAAVIRRKLTGRGLATADRGHLHHVLQRNGLTTRRALIVVAALGMVASAGALATTALQNDVFALVAMGGVVLTLLTTRMFGYAEWTLVKKKFQSATSGLWRRTGDTAPWELAVRLQGTADWHLVWRDLIRCADSMSLHSLCLDVNAPALHENYHARWDRRGTSQPEGFLWRLDLPLFANDQLLGRVSVAGARDARSMADTLQVLAEIVEGAEARAHDLAALPSGPVAPAKEKSMGLGARVKVVPA